MMTQPKTIQAEVEKFLSDTGIKPTDFGRSALNDPNFVADLRNGRRVWPETAEKVRAFIASKLESRAA